MGMFCNITIMSRFYTYNIWHWLNIYCFLNRKLEFSLLKKQVLLQLFYAYILFKRSYPFYHVLKTFSRQTTDVLGKNSVVKDSADKFALHQRWRPAGGNNDTAEEEKLQQEKAHFQHCFIYSSYRPKLTLQNHHENVSGHT